jgi:hypothetical protein
MAYRRFLGIGPRLTVLDFLGVDGGSEELEGSHKDAEEIRCRYCGGRR